MRLSVPFVLPETEAAEIWRLVTDSSLVGRGVLLALLLLSVLTWAVVAKKILELARARRQSTRLRRLLDAEDDLRQVYRKGERLRASPMCALLTIGYERTSSGRVKGPALWTLLQGVAAEELGRLERHLPVLATSASVSPFIGLLGTVWGIMAAFQDIGLRGSASLAVVAPGIAEALVATAAGLAVAIPAVIAHNYFNARVDALAQQMERFAADLAVRLEGAYP